MSNGEREGDRIAASRIYERKRDAERDAKWMKQHGGRRVTVAGKVGRWQLQASMPIHEFATFCAMEAKREST